MIWKLDLHVVPMAKQTNHVQAMPSRIPKAGAGLGFMTWKIENGLYGELTWTNQRREGVAI